MRLTAVVYNNDANAAALYAHQCFFGEDSMQHSSVSAIVGIGFGGGVIDNGRVIRGSCGMTGELGHIRIFWKICCRTINRFRNATVVFTAIWKALRR